MDRGELLMTSALPEFSETDLALAARVGEIAAPLLKQGMDLEEVLIHAYREAGEEFIRQGGDVAEIRRIVKLRIEERETFPQGEVRSLNDELHSDLLQSFEEYLASLPEGAVRLDEVKVTAKTGFKMFFYPNESKHAGFPHLTALLKGHKINISLEEEPRVVAGKRNLPGEAAVLRAVKEHRPALLAQWHETRPDDQKIPPKPNNLPGQEAP